MTTPADELRTAAATLRALATAASTDTDGTPTAHWNSKNQGPGRSLLCGDYTTNGRGELVGWPSLARGGSFQRPSYMSTQHAEYAAAMGPAVGLALADWLEYTASMLAAQTHPDWQDLVGCNALAVARAINGSQQ